MSELLKEDIAKKLASFEGVTVEQDRELTKFSTMKAKSFGSLVTIENEDALSHVILKLNSEKIDYRVIGWGANFLIPFKPDFILVKLDFPISLGDFDPSLSEWSFPANVSIHQLTSLAIKYGLVGWEVFTGVPGTLGGSIFMNAGTSLGEISQLIKEVIYLTSSGELITKEVTESDFSYRKNKFLEKGDIIVSATIKNCGKDENISSKIKAYLKKRQETQPLREKTCGCMFKNAVLEDEICPAGLFIDIMGMKGYVLESFRVNTKHANFLENIGPGVKSGAKSSLKHISSKLSEQYGIDFEQEIQE